MTDIIARNITKTYRGRVRAVSDLCCEVRGGELLAMVGPSGSGKSTLLRIIAGLETADSGSIHIGGRAMDGVPPRERNIGMMFQSHALYPRMTVRENIAFGLRLRRLARRELDHRVEEVADSLQITTLLPRLPRELSGGESRRVALARALVRRPSVLLMDEPLTSLDRQLAEQIREEIRRLQRQWRATMLYVTHDQVEAMALGDRVAVLHQGRIQQVDTPDRLLQHPSNEFVADFLGTGVAE